MRGGSKYIQATIGDGFKRIREWLLENPIRLLLVVGTGCQTAGLDLYLRAKNLRERVVLVDLICYGAASPGLWKRYIKHIGIFHKIDKISFKDKRYGWHTPSYYAKVKDKEIKINEFVEWFYGKWALRESCYKCPYTRVKRNSSDITIGDYWGIENVFPDFSDPNGVSLVILQTSVGKALFEEVKGYVSYKLSNENECLQPRLISPTEKPKDRKQFWDDIHKIGIDYCAIKYNVVQNNGIKFRVKAKIIMFFMKIFK